MNARGSWQPVEEVVGNAKADTYMGTIKDKFGHEEHEETSLEAHIDNNKEYTEHHSDREEFKAIDQYTTINPCSITLRMKPGKKSNGTVKESKKLMRASDIDAVKEDDNETKRNEGGGKDD